MPAFERCGRIYEFRLMMDFSGANRGYCFVTYTCREDARRAVADMNNHEIRRGRFLGVCMSVDNCRLFIGGIPKNKQQVCGRVNQSINQGFFYSGLSNLNHCEVH